MAERNPPVFIAAGGEQAEHARRLVDAIVSSSEGVVEAEDLHVTQNNTPNMSVLVGPGRAFIAGDEATRQGMYFVENDSIVNLAIAAADGTNGRKDLVVARVRDAEYSGVDNQWALEVITGTPAGSPVEPAVPDNAIVLAMVDVPANDTAITNGQITERRRLIPAAAAPLGYVTDVSSTAPSASTSGTTELTHLTTAAVTPPRAGRIWRVSLYARGVNGDPVSVSDLYILRLRMDGVEIGDNHVDVTDTQMTGAPMVVALVKNVGLVPHTFTATIQRAQGTGTAVVDATATSPRRILVEDIGAVPIA